MAKYTSLNEVPDSIKSSIGRYVSDIHGDVFVLRNLPPEMAGGILARYSRSPHGLRLTLVNEFLDEVGNPIQAKGTELLERVLIGFGDDSVGELEGAHIGIENISQIATKYIEDRRIGGSPIEQSTRYVKYDKMENGKWKYLRPKEIMESGFKERFERTNDRAFEIYKDAIDRLFNYFKEELPKSKFKIEIERGGIKVECGENELLNESEIRAFNTAYNFTIRCAALDVGRCVLPSSTLTNLGLFGNGRFYTNLITHLKSSNLLELQEKGIEIERALNSEIPTFIKRNKIDDRFKEIDDKMREISKKLFSNVKPELNQVTLLPREEFLDEVVASSLYPYTNVSLTQIMKKIKELPIEKKLEIINVYKGKRNNRRDRTGRGLEAGYPITFDLVGGFAEYRDLERHRMLTQQRQTLTTELGFIMPYEMEVIGLKNEIEELESIMSNLNSDMRHAGLYEVSQYATLFNHKIRWMMGMNLREFQHLSELRTTPQGHFSYRSMVMEMARLLGERDGWVKNLIEYVDYSDPGNKISRAKEQSRIARESLKKKID
ncbi:MAG: FAD-dependent thymidylate synthase [Candidatus Pacearchaeota archaeon]